MKLKKLAKVKKITVLIGIFVVEILLLNIYGYSQQIEAKIKLVSPSLFSIEGKILDEKLVAGKKEISFLQNYADVSNLGDRIENVQLFNKAGSPIAARKNSTGLYNTDEAPFSWKYDVAVAPSKTITDSAHVSWVSADQGLLMLADLLPEFNGNNPVSAKITLDIPLDWRIATSETKTGENIFTVKDIEKAVFLIGKNWRERVIKVEKSNLTLNIAGEWQFTDDEILEMTRSITEYHQKVFSAFPSAEMRVLLLPFPQKDVAPDRWRAETRGSTVTIISGAIPQRSVAIQRLHEQLRHEIFHYWLPNGVNLSGNYDWFYEGFTIYHALRTGVDLGQIRFEDFLNTLSQAYRITNSINQSISLVDSSRQRWNGSNNYIYAKGLLVAFLCDVELLRESKGKRNLNDIFRAIYQKYAFPNEKQDGNTAISGILKSYPALIPIVQNYVDGSQKVNWDSYLEAAGIEIKGSDSQGQTALKLVVKDKLSGKQKDLLDNLGYNQWRKNLQQKK